MIKEQIDYKEIETIKSLIAANQTFAITTHHNPDGDAMGSSTALAEVLRQMGKTVKIVLPNDFPKFFRWMHGTEDVLLYDRQAEDVKQYIAQTDVVFCLDYNQLSRIDSLETIIANCNRPRIVIDHHLNLQIENAAAVSVTCASSTSELLYHVLELCGYQSFINLDVAESIYTGIMTDTGRLDYSSSYLDVYQVVGSLVAKGIRKADIHENIFNVYSYDRMRLFGTVVKDNFVYFPEYHSAYLTITLKNQKDFNFQLGDSEAFVNQPLLMHDIRFCALFTEYENNTIKVSLRSKGNFPASDFARDYYNGGGHLNAAGGRFNGSLRGAIDTFNEGLQKYRDLLIK